ncbi:MotA/TolQ/ExbB proton channel family protein [Thermodesulforhabdus norvegica]|uniref:Biopolymer transport protein ExbB/TolQ n=1 Tax=Thermodesulforhabdus norvegica TaxID=39841 RepID=A0A1I4QYA6_9BACT|nr:MotA/TolQ/ExbB proton channel family protein [Thermodesulforhabdus norvegica]SFM44673.1 Biopolymer transport protein ExbB/TolQ [Thermodesulforhabdus norvegica]
MNFLGAFLTSFIYLVSSTLLYPVLLLLSILTLWSCAQCGAFLGEWIARRRFQKTIEIDDGNRRITLFLRSSRVAAFYESLRQIQVRRDSAGDPHTAYLLVSAEEEARSSLDWLRLVVRTGPMLGLMGTLIPMGTGLAALSRGDIGRLSSDLVIAFTTTVVGLAQGGLAYWIHTIRRRWIEADCLQMEYLAELITGKHDEERDTVDEAELFEKHEVTAPVRSRS